MSKKVRDRARWHFGFFSEKTWLWTSSLFIWNAKEKEKRRWRKEESFVSFMTTTWPTELERYSFAVIRLSISDERVSLQTCSLYSSRSDDLFRRNHKTQQEITFWKQEKNKQNHYRCSCFFALFFSTKKKLKTHNNDDVENLDHRITQRNTRRYLILNLWISFS